MGAVLSQSLLRFTEHMRPLTRSSFRELLSTKTNENEFFSVHNKKKFFSKKHIKCIQFFMNHHRMIQELKYFVFFQQFF